jgi:hypothetical protein
LAGISGVILPWSPIAITAGAGGAIAITTGGGPEIPSVITFCCLWLLPFGFWFLPLP